MTIVVDLHLRRLLAARDADGVVRHLDGLVHEAAAGYFIPGGGDRDDLLQAARIGVASAVRDFRGDGPDDFPGFAFFCARRSVITAVKTATRGKNMNTTTAAPLDAPPAGAADEASTLGELLLVSEMADPLRIVLAREALEEVLTRLQLLTGWEKECLARANLLGESYEQIGPRKSVDNALQRARHKLRGDRSPATRTAA